MKVPFYKDTVHTKNLTIFCSTSVYQINISAFNFFCRNILLPSKCHLSVSGSDLDGGKCFALLSLLIFNILNLGT